MNTNPGPSILVPVLCNVDGEEECPQVGTEILMDAAIALNRFSAELRAVCPTDPPSALQSHTTDSNSDADSDVGWPAKRIRREEE